MPSKTSLEAILIKKLLILLNIQIIYVIFITVFSFVNHNDFFLYNFAVIHTLYCTTNTYYKKRQMHLFILSLNNKSSLVMYIENVH
jgi:hypothetical protein